MYQLLQPHYSSSPVLLSSAPSVNVFEGEREERMMMTGMHTVVDIYCVGCCSLLGWKYESAEDKSQKYKEGKFILERFQILGPDGSGYSGSHEAQLEGGSDGDEA
ncbi:protein yippee-like isoform X2 [Ipomoea triloba]|uniref:protein yippee-like isoform X2 n=1 Tax=Ipomoea triloba TaxID=35885 RepID=UPI00125D1D83|nr:protein yippee-like isoform X2 [Ipomoea triloba]